MPPMLAAISPLVALPAITSQFGEAGWSSVAVGQAVGAATAVVVELGWGLGGPQRVAKQSLSNRRQTFATALLLKGVVFVPCAIAAAGLTFLLSPTLHLEAVLVSVGAAASGLNMVWYFVGTASPRAIVLTDAIPRLFFMTLTAVGLYVGMPLWTYGVTLLTTSFLAPGLGVLAVRVSLRSFTALSPSRLVRVMSQQIGALSGRALLAIYISMPVVLVTIVAPSSVPVFAAAERLMRMSLSLLVAVPNSMQRWIGTATTLENRLDRAIKALITNSLLGLAAGAGFALVAPPVSEKIFSGVGTIPHDMAYLAGCVIFMVCCSRASGGLLLVSLRQVGAITASSALGCLLGIVAIYVLASEWGGHGAFVGEIFAELSVLLAQLVSAVIVIRKKNL